MAMNRDAMLTRAEAAKVTGRPESTIGNWNARGWVTPDGERRRLTTKKQPDGTLKYRLGDLLDAERDTHFNPKSRRVRRATGARCRSPQMAVSGGR